MVFTVWIFAVHATWLNKTTYGDRYLEVNEISLSGLLLQSDAQSYEKHLYMSHP